MDNHPADTAPQAESASPASSDDWDDARRQEEANLASAAGFPDSRQQPPAGDQSQPNVAAPFYSVEDIALATVNGRPLVEPPQGPRRLPSPSASPDHEDRLITQGFGSLPTPADRSSTSDSRAPAAPGASDPGRAPPVRPNDSMLLEHAPDPTILNMGETPVRPLNQPNPAPAHHLAPAHAPAPALNISGSMPGAEAPPRPEPPSTAQRIVDTAETLSSAHMQIAIARNVQRTADSVAAGDLRGYLSGRLAALRDEQAHPDRITALTQATRTVSRFLVKDFTRDTFTATLRFLPKAICLGAFETTPYFDTIRKDIIDPIPDDEFDQLGLAASISRPRPAPNDARPGVNFSNGTPLDEGPPTNLHGQPALLLRLP